MIALYIILGIIAAIVLLLSVRINLTGEYFDSFKLEVSWLFLKFQIFPLVKKEKKEKPKKEEPPKPQKEPQPEVPGEKKENIFLTFYNNQGVEGVEELINNAAYSVARLFASFRRHIVIRELYLWITVCSNADAAQTAIDYGRMCQKVFPPLGFICSNLTVKKYDCEIEPDFIGKTNSAQFAFKISVRPIFILNAGIVLLFRLLFKVVIKFISGIKNKASNKETIQKEGVLQ